MKNIIALFVDLLCIIKGKLGISSINEYRFGFLVSSRNYKDLYRKYPYLKFLPKKIVLFIMSNLWPITLSEVIGLNSIKNGKPIKGYVLGITMTAEQMMNNRPKALRKIRQALYLAKGKGINIIGLGGLTSSLSRGGIDLIDIPICITTGHAYTAFNIVQTLSKTREIFNISKEKSKIAVVGSAGSVGTTSSLLLVREGYQNIVLIDLERKNGYLCNLEKQIKSINQNISIKISYNISDIHDCNFVITATNTHEALVTVDHVRDGMIIIDDAQPSDIDMDVLKLNNVLVLEAGVVHTPGIKSNFDYGLKNKTDNFCCMAELLILASNEWNDHYVINKATLKNVDEIVDMGKTLGFQVASFQNFLESISQEKIDHIKSVISKKHGI